MRYPRLSREEEIEAINGSLQGFLAALEKEYAQGETGVVGTYLSSNDSDGISEEVFEGRCREARREARAEE